jgi:glycosyltransferase involved in cell wall biosynthesis
VPRSAGKVVRIMLIVGEPVGGIRKHVHDIIFGLSGPDMRFVYAYADRGEDAAFWVDRPRLESLLGSDCLMSLPIRKKPHPEDVVNIWRLAHWAIRHRVSMVHGHGSKGGAYARILGAILPWLKTLYTPHGGSLHEAHGVMWNRVFGLIEAGLVPFTSMFVFESRYMRDTFHRRVHRCSGKEVVNHNGIALPLPAQDLAAALVDPRRSTARDALARLIARSPGELHVCCIGRLQQLKGQKFFIQALAESEIAGSDVHAHLLGDGPDRRALMEAVENLGLRSRVHFHGDSPDAWQLLPHFDACVIPSLHESFGYVAVEAMAMGIPVIASAAGGLIEVLDLVGSRSMVMPGNPKALAGALISFRDNRAEAISRASEVQKRIPGLFGRDRMLSRLRAIYHRLIIDR